jgi:potassium efflux system protein
MVLFLLSASLDAMSGRIQRRQGTLTPGFDFNVVSRQRSAFTWLLGRTMVAVSLESELPVSMGTSLQLVAPLVLFVSLLRNLLLKGGLAEAHFRWTTGSVRRLRNQVSLLILTFILPAFAMTLAATRIGSTAYGEITRVLMLLALCGLAYLFYRMLQPSTGIVAILRREESIGRPNPREWVKLGFSLAVPALLAVAIVSGYLYSAGLMLAGVISTLWLITALVLSQETIYRWLLVSRRRLRLRQRLARREAAEESQSEADSIEGMRAVPNDSEVDLEALDADTRLLVRSGLALIGLLGLLAIWADLLPALSVLDDVNLWSTTAGSEDGQTLRPVTLAQVLLAVLVLFGMAVAVRTVPSALEIVLRQRPGMVQGSRLAAATLCRYTILMIGLFTALNLFGVSWGKLQWLVAALGVGIGFGLQEIVANFISGLIILVERPVRVGDVVTVGDVEGVVTRIQIRATTVKNWNGQEHLVPNKELISGRVLNWSLSDEITRLVIPVGVAYGSNVQQALVLLSEVAQEHPCVMDEPAPFVGFFGFGDNALNLELRAFVKQIGDRLTTLSELNQAIDQKFRAADIAISFPQRDVHLDTVRPLEVRLHRDQGTNPED